MFDKTLIEWRKLPGGRAVVPYLGDERMPYTVCKIGPISGPQVYEAWSRPHDNYRQPEMIACNLASADEAKTIVEDKIKNEGRKLDTQAA